VTKKIGLSILALLVVFCMGLSLVAAVGAVVILQNNSPVPVEVTPTPQSGIGMIHLTC